MNINRMTGQSLIRHLLLLILGPAVVVGVGAWFYLQGGRYVSTDNAYIKHDIISISSEITGRLVEVIPKENQKITKGQLLFRIDDQPYRIALAKAEANIANVRANIESEKASYINTRMDISKATTDLDFRFKEKERIRKLLDSHSIPQAQFDQAEYAWMSTENEMETKKQELLAAKARLIDPDMSTEQHPLFRQATAELEKVQLDISHLEIRSPADGIAVNVDLHVGEYIVAGSQLFSLVDTTSVWLEANFKETDLTWVRPGQSVTVTVDAFPDQEWQAVVDGITPATGSEFSLLPAQNSSGNWIKVVQRIKVNIALQDYDDEFPLSAGMSAIVNIDTGRTRTLPWVATN